VAAAGYVLEQREGSAPVNLATDVTRALIVLEVMCTGNAGIGLGNPAASTSSPHSERDDTQYEDSYSNSRQGLLVHRGLRTSVGYILAPVDPRMGATVEQGQGNPATPSCSHFGLSDPSMLGG
jgi:hypothetical protein